MTTIYKSEYQSSPSDEKILRVIANNPYADIGLILQETKLSIRTVRHRINKLLQRGEIRKIPCFNDMRRVYYRLEDE